MKVNCSLYVCLSNLTNIEMRATPGPGLRQEKKECGRDSGKRKRKCGGTPARERENMAGTPAREKENVAGTSAREKEKGLGLQQRKRIYGGDSRN